VGDDRPTSICIGSLARSDRGTEVTGLAGHVKVLQVQG
jgi:hypothetical protein